MNLKKLLIYASVSIVVLSGIHFLFTGSIIPLFYRDKLLTPKYVQRFDTANIVFDTGDIAMLPFVRYVPTNEVFRIAVENGIEVAQNGRMYGLLKLWHWCVNDPVRYDLRRVDLSCLAIMLDPNCYMAQTHCDEVTNLIQHLIKRTEVSNRYSANGWNVNNYYVIQQIESSLQHSNHDPQSKFPLMSNPIQIPQPLIP